MSKRGDSKTSRDVENKHINNMREDIQSSVARRQREVRVSLARTRVQLDRLKTLARKRRSS